MKMNFNLRSLAVAACYLFAAAFLARDPWFGRELFTYAQGGYVILIAMVMVATICFDWCYLGPSRGINFFLQFLLLLPMTLVLGRLIGSPSERLVAEGTTVLAYLKSAFTSVANVSGVLEIIPDPVKELFASFRSACLFLMICFSLTAARNKLLRVGLVVTIFAFLISFALADAKDPPSLWFLAGLVLCSVGMVLQFHDMTPEVVDRNILERLRNVTDEAERRCSIRVLKKVYEEGKVAPQTVVEIVHRCYAEQFGVAPEVVKSQIAPTLLGRLVTEHGLLEISYARGIAEIRPTAALLHPHNPLLALALVPRCVVVGVIALVWWLTPIDLIPDAIPVVGSLDDFVIVSLGGGGVLQALKSLKNNRPHPALPLEG